MAAQEKALDIPEPQVAVDFPDDQFFTWHVRVLVTQLGDGGRWVAFSPDLEPEVIDLADHRVVPLVRDAVFPQRIRGDVYYRVNITEDDLTNTVQECRALAAVLGVTGPSRPTTLVADWVYADPAFDRFGEVVDSSLTMNPATMLSRDSVALVRVGADDGVEWTTAERIPLADVDLWKDEKRSGPGRDPRVLPLVREGDRARFRSLRSIVSDTTYPDPKAPDPDWPFPGPSAVKELLAAARAAGEELTGFHDYFLRSSGLNPDHAVAIKHRDLLAIMLHFLNYDQVNAGRLAGMEAMARYVLQIHQAVRRNPKNPDFKGTSVFTLSHLGSSGGVLTGDFARYVADEQKSHAFMLKQHRLYAEEEEKRRNAKNTENAGGGGGKK